MRSAGAISALMLVVSILTCGCTPKSKDDKFLERPIQEQLDAAKNISTDDLYRLYLLSVQETGATHLSQPLGERGASVNAPMLRRLSAESSYIYPNRYMPVIMDTCWYSSYCQCEDGAFVSALVERLHKASMYPSAGANLSATPLGRFCSARQVRGNRGNPGREAVAR